MRYAKLNNGKELWVASTETHKDNEGEVVAFTFTTDEGEVLSVSVAELSCWWQFHQQQVENTTHMLSYFKKEQMETPVLFFYFPF